MPHPTILVFSRSIEVLSNVEKVLLRKGMGNKEPVYEGGVYQHELDLNEGVRLTYSLITLSPDSEPFDLPRVSVVAVFGSGSNAPSIVWFYHGETGTFSFHSSGGSSQNADFNTIQTEAMRYLKVEDGRISNRLSEKDAFKLLNFIAIRAAFHVKRSNSEPARQAV
jgi:hypothetical protein